MRIEYEDFYKVLQFKTADEIRQVIPDWNLGSAWIDATQAFGGSGLREPHEAGEICLVIAPLCKGQPIDGPEPQQSYEQSYTVDIDYAVGAYIQDDVVGSHGFIDLAKTAEWAASTAAFPEIPAETVGFEDLPVVPSSYEAEDLLYEVYDLLYIQTSDSVFGIGENARKEWIKFAEHIADITTVRDSKRTWEDIDASVERMQSNPIKGATGCWTNTYISKQDDYADYPIEYSVSLHRESEDSYKWEGSIYAITQDSVVPLDSISMRCINATETLNMTQTRMYEKLELYCYEPWIDDEAYDALADALQRENGEAL